ncbi:MAG: AAA family ATPase [Bacteroidia bacterium]
MRILLTGGPGFGKSSIISHLENMGHAVFHEVAREIIREEQEIGGEALPWINIHAFSEKVLQGRIRQHAEGSGRITFYDRGLPDIAAFIKKDKKAVPETVLDLCSSHRYHQRVFITPPWESIFHRDAERKEDFAAAIRVHKAIEQIFPEMGYDLIDVPMGSVKWRAEFILNKLGMM